MKFKSKLHLILTGIILIFLTTSGAVCKSGDPAAQQAIKTKVTLNYWRVFDGQDAFKEIIDSYRKTHPNITINYRLLHWEEYETELLDAWAEGRGPDIFSLHNSWTHKYKNKILPLPETIKTAYLIKAGQNPEAGFKELTTIKAHQLKDYFPSVVYDDLVIDNQIYGLPLSIDTLSLYYNQNLLDAAGITSPPITWGEVAEISKQIAKQDTEGNIAIASIALGGAKNISRSADILSLLMMQNGTEMIKNGAANFHQRSSLEQDYFPGRQALTFYTDFAKASKEVYTWNEDLDEAQNMFLQGKLAMMLGYSYQLPLLQSQGPKLDIRITKIPHILANGTDTLNRPVNYANYWAESVYKNSSHPDEAWDFINFMTTQNEQAKKYISKTQKPAALRSIISEQLNDPELGIFASQVLTAQTWYHGSQPEYLEDIFKSMIEQVTLYNLDINKAINFGAERINQIL